MVDIKWSRNQQEEDLFKEVVLMKAYRERK
jgi:hypothetical protein